jgi:hypothetical protein
MTKTGWISDEPEETHAPGFAGFILQNRADPNAGRTLEEALARAAHADDRRGREEPVDPDDRIAALVTRGYVPGQVSHLALRLQEVESELAAEEDKLEKAAHRSEWRHRDHAAGRITVADIVRMQAGDTDEGDPAAVERLSKRAAGLREQIRETMAMISPAQARTPDAYEAAASRAHQVFVEATRAQLAEAQGQARARSRVASRSASPPKAEGEPCGCGVPGCTAYPVAAERKASPYSEFSGRAVTRDGGHIVSVR